MAFTLDDYPDDVIADQMGFFDQPDSDSVEDINESEHIAHNEHPGDDEKSREADKKRKAALQRVRNLRAKARTQVRRYLSSSHAQEGGTTQ